MAGSLRELLLSLKVKVDKAAIKQTDVAFDHAAKSAQVFENGAYKALAPLKKIGEALTSNVKKARELAKALLPAGALPSRPEAPSNRLAREARDALGLSHGPHAPRPGQSLAAPDISAFMVPEATPDFRTGPQKAVAAGLAGIRSAAQSALAEAGSFVDRFNARFDGTIKAIFNVRTAMAGLAVVVAGTAIGRFFNDVIEAGGALHDMAQRTRVSVETLQVWRGIATDAGVDANSLEGVFRKLNKSMAAAARGSKIQAASFKDLGVEVKNADGSMRPIEDVLIDTGSALAGMEDDAKATAIATQLLGPAGMGLVPAFNQGAAAVRKLSAEMKENVALNAEEAARLDDVGDALTRGQKKWTALKTRAIVALLPVLEAVSGAFEKTSKWILRMAKETETIHTIILAVTAGGLFRLVTLLGSWIVRVGGARAALALFGQGLQTAASFAFRFLLPLLLIEDFLTFLAGGKSVFGRAFEEIFGPGGAQSVRDGILAVLTEVKDVLSGGIIGALTSIGTSEFFKGGAKIAAEGILAVLHAIGLALADNTEKAEALAKALRKNLEALGVAPTEEGQQKTLDAGRPEDLGGAKREAPKERGFLQRAAAAVFGDSSTSPGAQADVLRNQAIAARMRQETAPHAGGAIGPLALPNVVPVAPVAAKAPVTLTDNRKIEVNVGTNATPGATGRAVGGAVDAELTKDRRQTLNAL